MHPHDYCNVLFQSTHSQRVRPLCSPQRCRCDFISIHALTKSATAASIRDSIHYLNFNPRTHKECDSVKMLSYCLIPYFNPRTHKECDRLSTNKQRRLYDFNPRTHKECDAFFLYVVFFSIKFQSTHSQRVRPTVPPQIDVGNEFQSTHSQRVRPRSIEH